MSTFHHLFLPHHSNNQRARLLHPTALSIVIGFFAVFQLGLNFFTRSYPHVLGYASQISPAEIVRLTNVERQRQGLGALQLDSQLTQAALRKAGDMFARDYWAHVSPSGTQPWYFVSDAGYAYRYAGENLARDFSQAADIVQAWMDSPTHRDNLLSPRYQDVGIAVVDGTLGGTETTLVVQMFGTRLAAAPSVAGNTLSVKAQTVAEIQPTLAPTPAVAQVSQLAPSEYPLVSPYSLTRYLSIVLLVLFTGIFLADIIIAQKRHLVRWTSKSLAHFIFLAALLAAAAVVARGQIL